MRTQIWWQCINTVSKKLVHRHTGLAKTKFQLLKLHCAIHAQTCFMFVIVLNVQLLNRTKFVTHLIWPCHYEIEHLTSWYDRIQSICLRTKNHNKIHRIYQNLIILRFWYFARQLPGISIKFARQKIQLSPENQAIGPISSGSFTNESTLSL